MVDTPFTSFPFPATSAPTSRTMPDRLNEVVNVKNYGALGNSTNGSDGADDTTSIQNAANVAMARRAVLQIPYGIYRITAPILFNDANGMSHLDIQGNGALIAGSFNDFLFKRAGDPVNQFTSGIRRVSGMRFSNGHATGGCLMWNANIGAHVTDCYFDGNRGLTMEWNQSSKVSNCICSKGGGSNQYVGSFGISAGDNVIIEACDITGFQTAVQVAGVGPIVRGCRFEVNNTGVKIGYDTLGPRYCSGVVVQGGSFESCGIALELLNCGRGYIGNFQIIGFPGAAPWDGTVISTPTTITGVTSSATGTATIAANGVMTLTGVSGTFVSHEEVTGTGLPTGSFLPNFLDQISGLPGKDGTYPMSGTPRYGIWCANDAINQTTFCALSCGVSCTQYGIYIGGSEYARAYNTFIGVGAHNSNPYGGQNWRIPPSAGTADFIACNISPAYLFVDLPSGVADGYPNAREGDRYRITNGPSGLAFGDPVTAGSGSTHYTVEYSNTGGGQWLVVGK